MANTASSFLGTQQQQSATREPQPVTESSLALIKNAIDIADKATTKVELLIKKSHSIFQAQQLTANADQV
jgi:hypothetical protein